MFLNNAGFCHFILLIMVVNVTTNMGGIQITNMSKNCRILPFYTSNNVTTSMGCVQITNVPYAGFCKFLHLILYGW